VCSKALNLEIINSYFFSHLPKGSVRSLMSGAKSNKMHFSHSIWFFVKFIACFLESLSPFCLKCVLAARDVSELLWVFRNLTFSLLIKSATWDKDGQNMFPEYVHCGEGEQPVHIGSHPTQRLGFPFVKWSVVKTTSPLVISEIMSLPSLPDE
jgi:hypothetical protein